MIANSIRLGLKSILVLVLILSEGLLQGIINGAYASIISLTFFLGLGFLFCFINLTYFIKRKGVAQHRVLLILENLWPGLIAFSLLLLFLFMAHQKGQINNLQRLLLQGKLLIPAAIWMLLCPLMARIFEGKGKKVDHADILDQ